jgi:hypothetical protein
MEPEDWYVACDVRSGAVPHLQFREMHDDNQCAPRLRHCRELQPRLFPPRLVLSRRLDVWVSLGHRYSMLNLMSAASGVPHPDNA